MPDKASVLQGCLLGLAVGDAMGYTVDNKTLDEIREDYGPNGLLGYDLCSGSAEITSYTQLAAYICNALLLSVTRSSQGKHLEFAKLGLREWTRSQQFARDPEVSHCWVAKLPAFRRRHCRDARMLDTLRLALMGFPDRAPNRYGAPGALTAAISVAMFYDPSRLTPPQLGELTAQIIRITHGDPTAFLSGVVLAYAMTGILMERSLPLEEQFSSAICAMEHMFAQKYPEAETVSATLRDAIDRAGTAVPMDNVMESLECFTALRCLAGAFYTSLANRHDFDTAMITAVNHSGCSSAVAGITGAILGAKMGYAALPDFYLESLEAAQALEQLADDMVSFTPSKGLFDDDWDMKYVQGMPLL